VYVFYFDVHKFVESFCREGTSALDRLRGFQRRARQLFEFGGEHSFVATLYDNVWSRINASEPGTPSLALNYAGSVMTAALEFGFSDFFGSITRGMHDFDPTDRLLIAGATHADLKEQHIDMTSEPHIRAALAEKWARRWKERPDAPAPNSVWVSREVVGAEPIDLLSAYPDATFAPAGNWFDIRDAADDETRRWPYSHSHFHAITPK
jgi:hypothetical protein